LLIENNHYQRLRDLIDRFGQFQFGKTRLMDLLNDSIYQLNLNEDEIESTIEQNRTVKEDYLHLLSEIETYFKDQIRGRSKTSDAEF